MVCGRVALFMFLVQLLSFGEECCFVCSCCARGRFCIMDGLLSTTLREVAASVTQSQKPVANQRSSSQSRNPASIIVSTFFSLVVLSFQFLQLLFVCLLTVYAVLMLLL